MNPALGEVIFQGDTVLVAHTTDKKSLAIAVMKDGKSVFCTMTPKGARHVAISLLTAAEAVDAGELPKPDTSVMQ